MSARTLPATRRVRKRRDFESAYAEGAKLVAEAFVLFVRRNERERSRIGVTATRRLGKNVVRNRAKRLVREAYRLHQDQFPEGYDYVVVVRAPLLDRKPAQLGPELVKAAREAERARRSG